MGITFVNLHKSGNILGLNDKLKMSANTPDKKLLEICLYVSGYAMDKVFFNII